MTPLAPLFHCRFAEAPHSHSEGEAHILALQARSSRSLCRACMACCAILRSTTHLCSFCQCTPVCVKMLAAHTSKVNKSHTAHDIKTLRGTQQGLSKAYLGVGGLPTAQAVAHSPRHSPAAALPSCQVAEAPPSAQAEAHLPIRPAHREYEHPHTAGAYPDPCAWCSRGGLRECRAEY